ncbi:hypothetical protein VTJ04DRAFT_7543 [Mycothermus thermophilus]|uniref:uncharacterized protein n=1 Tax=Humicola insolens TaxID=85995 RepID=UPI00374350A8
MGSSRKCGLVYQSLRATRRSIGSCKETAGRPDVCRLSGAWHGPDSSGITATQFHDLFPPDSPWPIDDCEHPLPALDTRMKGTYASHF